MFNPINDVDVRISGYRNSGIIFAVLAKFAHRYKKLVFLYALSFLLFFQFMRHLLNNPFFILIGWHLIFLGLITLWFSCSYVHAFLRKDMITTSLDHVFPYLVFFGVFPSLTFLDIFAFGYPVKALAVAVYIIFLAVFIRGSHKKMEKEAKRSRCTRREIEFDYDEGETGVYSDGQYEEKKCYVSFELRPAIVTRPGVELFKKVTITEDTLSLYIGCHRPRFIDKPFSINFQVSLIDKKGEEHFLTGKHVSPMENWEHTRWIDINCDVKKFRSEQVTIRLKSFAKAPHARNKSVYWGLPHFSDSSRCREAKKNILFLLDGCRPDFLGCFNPKMKGVSPAIDNLAGDAVLFQNAFSQGTWTLPSFISIFTGCFPSTTKSWHPDDYNPLGKDIPALTRYFKDAGYKTAALVCHTRLSPNYGFSRGFNRYYYQQRDFYYGNSITSDLFNRAIQFLENTKNDDVFLLVHVFDTHRDYRITDYTLNPDELASFNKGKSDDIFNDEKFLFRSAIKNADFLFSRIEEYLRIRGWYKNSSIVVSSDHGTEFTETREKYGHRLYDETIKIPLLVKCPEGFSIKNKSISAPIEATNAFLATLLDLNNIKYNNESDGSSLCHYIAGAIDALTRRDWAISEDIYPGHHAVACRTNKDKLVVSFLNEKTNRRAWGNTKDDKVLEYYDIEKDPDEQKNMIASAEKAQRISSLKDRIDNFLRNRKTRF